MADSIRANTILVVKAFSLNATTSLQSEHNINRFPIKISPDEPRGITERIDLFSSRNCPPDISRPPSLELHLEFDPGPQDASQGFVFGTDEHRCDVQLLEHSGQENEHNISRQHFRVEFEWDTGRLILINISQSKILVTTPSLEHGSRKLDQNGMHSLYPLEDTKISIGRLEFVLSFPDHSDCQEQYDRNWKTFCKKHQTSSHYIGRLHWPLRENPSLNRHRHGIYTILHEIGNGQLGVTSKVSGPPGKLFAVKQPYFRTPSWDAVAYMETVLHRNIKHKHIMNLMGLLHYDDIPPVRGPVLLMEHMPLGNLTNFPDLSIEEVRTMLQQSLEALAYLHDKDITHQNLRPSNILVRFRTPDLFIVLSDFILPPQLEYLLNKSFRGINPYAPPEIFVGGLNKNAVDIWALGVIAFEVIEGPPPAAADMVPKTWSDKINTAVQDVISPHDKPVIQLLKHMLSPDSRNRPTARDCLCDDWILRLSPFKEAKKSDIRFSEQMLQEFHFEPFQVENAWFSPRGFTEEPQSSAQPIVPGKPRKRTRTRTNAADNIAFERARRASRASNHRTAKVASANLPPSSRARRKSKIIRLRVARSRLDGVNCAIQARVQDEQDRLAKSLQFAPQPLADDYERMRRNLQNMDISMDRGDKVQTRKRSRSSSDSISPSQR